MSFNQVNEHCLQHLVGLSLQHDVVAGDDIFDDKGTKLWSKGNRVSAELQERLLSRKLAKPLECTLSVGDAVSFASVIDDALPLLDQHPLLKKISGHRESIALLNEMRAVHLPPPVRLLLTATRERLSTSYQHNLVVLLVAVGIGARLRASADDARTLLLAALLHDIGEMYIDPQYLHSTGRLSPKDWKIVAAHPSIGRLLIKELTNLPPAVGDSIALHHERLDGSGYPNQVNARQQSHFGAWLAVADSVTAIAVRGGCNSARRIAMALTVVPEEFNRDAVSAVVQALRENTRPCADRAECGCMERAKHAQSRLEQAMARAAQTAQTSTDPFARGAASQVLQILQNLRKSLTATGVIYADQLGKDIDDPELAAEICQIAGEVEWRLRNLARNIHLRAENHRAGQSVAELQNVIDALDMA